MHKSSYLRMKYLLDYYRNLFARENMSVKVLDIGSCDQNGTYRELFGDKRYDYIGLDMYPGLNVDIVPKDIYSWKEIDSNEFDLVISGQAFEHIAYPWLTMKEIERVLKPSGIGIIIAPNGGREHKAPIDCYRFFSDGLRSLAEWANLYVLHVGVAGVPYMRETDEWISEWNDATLVVQKHPKTKGSIEEPFKYERRRIMGKTILSTYKNMDIAVLENKKRFTKNKQIIIWGAGEVGRKVFQTIGSENVYCFVDNSLDKQGTYICGKMVISSDEFKKIAEEYSCLIAASYEASVEIAEQLRKERIEFGTLYPILY